MEKQKTSELPLKINKNNQKGSLLLNQEEVSSMSQHYLIIEKGNVNQFQAQIQNSFFEQLDDNILNQEQEMKRIKKIDGVYNKFIANAEAKTFLFISYISKGPISKFMMINDGTNKQIKKKYIQFYFQNNNQYLLYKMFLQVPSANLKNIEIGVFQTKQSCFCCSYQKCIDKLTNFLMNYSIQHNSFVLSTKYAKDITPQLSKIMNQKIKQKQTYLIIRNIQLPKNVTQKQDQLIQFFQKILFPVKLLNFNQFFKYRYWLTNIYLFLKLILRRFQTNQFNQFMVQQKGKTLYYWFSSTQFNQTINNLICRYNLQNKKEQSLSILIYKNIIYSWIINDFQECDGKADKYQYFKSFCHLLNFYMLNCTKQQLSNLIHELKKNKRIFVDCKFQLASWLFKLKQISLNQFMDIQFLYFQKRYPRNNQQLCQLIQNIIKKYKILNKVNWTEIAQNQNQRHRFVDSLKPLFQKMKIFIFKSFQFILFLTIVKKELKLKSQIYQFYKIFLQINKNQVMKMYQKHYQFYYFSLIEYNLIEPINQEEILMIEQNCKNLNSKEFAFFNQIFILFKDNKLKFTQFTFNYVSRIMRFIYLNKIMVDKDFQNHVRNLNQLNCEESLKNKINQFMIKLIKQRIFQNYNQMRTILSQYYKIKNKRIYQQYQEKLLVYFIKEQQKQNKKYIFFKELAKHDTIYPPLMIKYAQKHSQIQVDLICQQIFITRSQFLYIALKMDRDNQIQKLTYKLLNGKFNLKQSQLIFQNQKKIKKNIINVQKLRKSLQHYLIAFSKLSRNVKILKQNLQVYCKWAQFISLIKKYNIHIAEIQKINQPKQLPFQSLTSLQNEFIQYNQFYSRIKISKLWIQTQKKANITNFQKLVLVIANFYKMVKQKQQHIIRKNMSSNDFQRQFVAQIQQIFLLTGRLDFKWEINFVKNVKFNPQLQVQQFKTISQLLQKTERIMINIQRQDIIKINNFIQQIKMQISQYWRTELQNNLYNFIQKLKDLQIRKTRILNSNDNQLIYQLLKFIKMLYQDESQIQFIQFKSRVNQKSNILKIQQLRDLSKKIANQQQINTELTYQQVNHFINIYDYINKAETVANINQYVDYLKLLKSNQSQPHFLIQMSKTANLIFDDVIEELGLSQFGIPKLAIQNIVKQSKFVLSINDKKQVVIKIITIKLKLNKLKEKKQIIKEYSYQKLLNFEQTSLLFMTNIEDEQNAKNHPNYIYLSFYNIFNKYIQRIHEIIQKLIQYGFDPYRIQALSQNIFIKKHQSQDLQRLKNHLGKIEQKWIQYIKHCYSQSFLLSHCVGIKLYQFVLECFSFKYNYNIFQIIDLDQPTFKQLFLEINHCQFDNNIQGFIAQIDKLKQIIKPFQIQYLKKHQHLSQKQQKQMNHILYIKCPHQSIYYQIAKNQKDMNIGLNRLFFCSKDMTFMQLYSFVNRSLINPIGYYYIISPYKLQQNVKDQFKKLITELQKSGKFEKLKLCFVDQQTDHIIYSIFKNKKYFKIKQIIEEANQDHGPNLNILSKLLKDALIVQSSHPGLGKTFYVQKMTERQNRKLKYLLICGNINYSQLIKRIKSLNLTESDNLLIEVGYVKNIMKLQTFLAQIILFKCFYFQQFIFLPPSLKIFIELQNFDKNNVFQNCHILNVLKQNQNLIFFQKFRISDIIFSNSYDQNFIFNYLHNYDQNQIQKQQLPFKTELNEISNKRKEQLVRIYFQRWFQERRKQPTFIQYSNFKKVLLNYFKTFSINQFFKINNLSHLNIIGWKNFRSQFINICIQNSLIMVNQTVYISNFVQNQQNIKNQVFNQITDQLKLLIVSNQKSQSFNFAYKDDKLVPQIVKTLLITQNYSNLKIIETSPTMETINRLFAESDMTKLSINQLQIKIKQFLQQFSKNPRLQLKQSPFYQLTLDNFYKICLTIQKANCNIPIIIMGQSGVGKTALIEYLVENILEETFFKINVHAGVEEQILKQEVSKFKLAAQTMKQSEKVWVFFDQFNTTDYQSYIKEIIMDRRFMGQKLPSNIVFLAACNPYRYKKEINSGKKQISQFKQKKGNTQSLKRQNLAFLVNPPSLSLMQVMWNYNQLQQKQLGFYITKIIANIKYKKKKELIDSLICTHQQFIKNKQISSVSLRDVVRFKQIYEWFLQYIPEKEPNKIIKTRKNILTNYKMNREERAVILSYIFCYIYKLSNSNDRDIMLNKIEVFLKLNKNYMKTVMNNQQNDFATRIISQQQQIALNAAVKQNIMITLVCIANRIPILLIGPPGSSKTLSINILINHLQSQFPKNCDSEFVNKFPKLMIFYYQGSMASTSESVYSQFAKAEHFQCWKQQQNNKNTRKIYPCIIFDEIGLAERSKDNPLKVLHSKLQTNKKNICFIGVSNQELDAAKMSRFLILTRTPPNKQDCIQTAIQLNNIYSKNPQIYQNLYKKLGQIYFIFIDNWNKNKLNQKDFFGLRDFYGYIKYVTNKLKKIETIATQNQINKIVTNAIKINFDGRPYSAQQFHYLMSIPVANFNQNIISPIYNNVSDPSSRSLLLIINSDTVLPIIYQSLKYSVKQKKVVVIYGSPFLKDQTDQIHSIQTISLILNYVALGTNLIFVNINQNIQTSLYDLFNKNYFKVGNNKYCRTAIGANTKLRTYVHQEYNSIICINKGQIKNIDLAFINRFEKHQFTTQSTLKQIQIQMEKQIRKWLNKLLSFFRKETKIKLKSQNFILNISKQSVLSAIISESKNFQGQFKKSIFLKKVKLILLKNSTTDLIIAMNKFKKIDKQCEFSSLKKQCSNFSTCKNDMIVFTYDQQVDIQDKNQNCASINFSQQKNEKALKIKLRRYILNSCISVVKIYLNYQYDYDNLNYLLFTINKLKNQCKSYKQIKIFVMMHRCSLHNLKIDQIKISYVHRFQQFFVQKISQDDNLNQLLSTKDYYLIMKILKLQLKQKLSLYITSAINLIDIKVVDQIQQEQIRKIYFKSLLTLNKNNQFIDKMEIYILQIFQVKKFEQINIILMNDQNIRSCSSIYKAIQKIIQNQTIQIFVLFIKMLIQEDLLFILADYQGYVQQFLQSKLNIHPNLKKDILNSSCKYKAQIDYLLFEIVDNCLSKMKQRVILYQNKKLNDMILYEQDFTVSQQKRSNIILIQQRLSLIPTFNDHLPILFQIQQVSVSSLQSIWKTQYENIMAIIERSNNQDILHSALLMRQKSSQVMNIIKQSSFFAGLQDSQNLKLLFLMGIYQFCALQIFTKTPNQLKLESIYQIIIPHFLNLNINFQMKIMIATANRKYLNAYIQLLSILKIEQLQALQKLISQKITNIDNIFNIHQYILNTLMKYIHESILQANFYNVTDYRKYFKHIYLKIQQINKRIQNIRIQSQIYVLLKFFQLLQKLQSNSIQNYFLKFIKRSTKKHLLLELDIILFILQNIIRNQTATTKQIENICLYYSYNFLLLQRKDQIKQHSTEQEKIIKYIIRIINLYIDFASHSNCLIDFMININRQKKQSINEFFQQSSNYLQKIADQYPLINNEIDFQNNFSVCLSNYFTLILIEYTNNKFMQNEYDNFLAYINKSQSQVQPLIRIMMNSFVKIYCDYLVDSLKTQEQKDKIVQINQILKQQKQSMHKLKLFIFKKIITKYQHPKLIISLIQTHQLDCFTELLQDYKLDNELIPPNILNTHEFLRTFYQIKNSSEITNLIQQQIQQLSDIPENTYALLTAFMINYYRKPQSQELIFKIKSTLQNNIILNKPKNKIIKKLMLGYLQDSLGSLSFCRDSQHFKKIYHLFNYLNMIVSLKDTAYPLNQMFFDQKGLVIQQFKNWFDQRFIINSMPNPSVTRTKYLIQMKKKRNVGNSYTICSRKCDFIMPVGGQFEGKNMGCAQLNGESICYLCKGIIGGRHASPPTREKEGARIFAPNLLQTQLQRIQKVSQFAIENKLFKLKGYQIGNSFKQVGRYFQLWDQYQNRVMEFKTNNLVNKRIIQSIIYFVWYIFAELNLFNEYKIQTFFNLPMNEVKQFLYDAAMQLDNQVFKQIYKKPQNQDNVTIWHFGFGSIFFKYCVQFDNIDQNKGKQISLLNFESHNMFASLLDKRINKIYDIKRESVIYKSRASMKQMIHNNLQLGLKLPPNMKIYHDVDISMRASSQHILKYYGSYIQKNHLILSVFFRVRCHSQWLISIKNIYLFVSTLHKECNFKINRTDANKETKQFIRQYFKVQNKIQYMLDLFNHFIKGWKYLSDKQYQLRFQCQVLGTLQPIDQNCQLSYCLIDTDDLNNAEGRQLISLLQVTANQYNQIMGNLQNQILLARPQYQKYQIFNSTLLNPMSFTQNNKMLTIFQQLLEDKIKIYSNYSVEEGVTNISYAFEQIESFIIQQVRGLNYFSSNKQQMKKIHFIGQNQYFLQKLERSSIQKSLRQTGNEDQTINWIMNQKAQRKDVFFKNIKQLQTSLQHILIYYQNTKIESFADQTIQDFVNNKRIIVNAELFKNQIISKLKMENIVDLYYLIELYSFQNVAEQLPKDYQSQQLTQNLKTKITNMLQKMIKIEGQFSQGLPNYSIFKMAVYRLAGRNLVIQRFLKDVRIWDILSNDHHYWSKEIGKMFYNLNFSFSEDLSTTMQQIYLSQTKSFLKLLPFEKNSSIDY